MAIPDDKMRIQAVVDRKLMAKIDDLAGRMGISQSKMVAFLLENAVHDDEWLIRVVTNKFTKAILEAVGLKKRSKKPETK